MTQDRRILHRIPNQFGTDLTGSLKIDDHQYKCVVNDYNTKSISLNVTEEVIQFLLEGNSINQFLLKKGTEVIANVKNPILLSYNKDSRKLILILQTNLKMLKMDRIYRSKIPSGLQGQCLGPDPIKFGQLLNFKIIDISSDGFLAISSKSNRHLTPGVRLDSFEFTFPGAGLAKASAIIRHAEVRENDILFGCNFTDVAKKSAHIINGYYYICTNSTDPQYSKKIIERKNLLLKEFVRIERVSSLQVMDEVLKIRYASYKSAGKLDEEITSYTQMLDAYDNHSIILAAFLGTKIVGTIRIVFSENHEKFPFEEIFEIPKKVPRNELVEVSKLAILPEYQGSDIILKLFQSFAAEFIPKKRYALCMATKKLSRYYTSIGAKKVSVTKPHPQLENESLTCYLFDRKRMLKGKMKATAWFLFGKDVADFLSKFGFTKKPRFSPRLQAMRIIEGLFLRAARLKKKPKDPKNV